MNWEAVAAVVAILAFGFTVFIEWPRFKARLNESQNTTKRIGNLAQDLAIIVFFVCAALGSLLIIACVPVMLFRLTYGYVALSLGFFLIFAGSTLLTLIGERDYFMIGLLTLLTITAAIFLMLSLRNL